MTEILTKKHGNKAPPTQNRGSYPIDGLFATRTILHSQCCYLSGLDAIGNHRCLWINIPEVQIFGTTMPAAHALKARWLKTEDPQTVKKYLDYMEKRIMTHDLLNKTKTISDLLHDPHDLTKTISNQLDNIDTLKKQTQFYLLSLVPLHCNSKLRPTYRCWRILWWSE